MAIQNHRDFPWKKKTIPIIPMITRPGYVIEKANWKMEVLYGFIWFYMGNIH